MPFRIEGWCKPMYGARFLTARVRFFVVGATCMLLSAACREGVVVDRRAGRQFPAVPKRAAGAAILVLTLTLPVMLPAAGCWLLLQFLFFFGGSFLFF